jgi:hypothetical protein
LTFTQKSKCGEDGESPKFHTHQRPSSFKREREREKMMLALPCYIQKNIMKKRGQKNKKNNNDIYKRKKKMEKREKEDSPLLDLFYHQGHGPYTLTVCVV